MRQVQFAFRSSALLCGFNFTPIVSLFRCGVKIAVCAGLFSALAACETETIGEKMVGTKVMPPPSTLVEETFGRGSTEITLLMAKAANGRYEGAAQDIRDGAALAIGELDEGAVLKIRVVDVAAGPSALPAAVDGARLHNSGLIVAYAPQATMAALAAMPIGQRPPVINLGDPATGQDVFNFGPDEMASAIKGARFAVTAGQRKIAVLAPATLAAGSDERLRNGIAQAGGLATGIIRYPASSASVGEMLAGSRPVLDGADAVVILGEGPMVATLLRGVRSGFPKLAVIGTDHWPLDLLSDPAAANVVLSAFDPEGLSVIRERYRRYNKRDVSVYAALGYDSLAMVAGLVRGSGREALTGEALRAKTGFRGTTGLFRFTPAGNVERREGLYRVTGGKLVPVEAGGAARF
jgi:ABC-type branched-subunit amino acid transport system substrate-binding protein